MPVSKETIRIRYGDGVTVLPLAAADAVGRASGLYCKILMLLCADSAYRENSTTACRLIAEAAECDEADVQSALAYFAGAGVLEYTAAKDKSAKKPKKDAVSPMPNLVHSGHEEPAQPERKLQRADEMPQYSINELATLLEERKGLSLFVDECQRAYGKIFNTRDVNVILGMTDYLALSEEYILILLRYFGDLPEDERKSVHYIERTAISLVNDGVTDAPALLDYLERLKLLRSHQGTIREIFGMGTRAFTAKEKKSIMLWLGEYGVDIELIRMAYERTVNATGKPSVPYASKIIERWHSEGIKTKQDLERVEQEKAESLPGGNFETNDFFEAALRRSYGDDMTIPRAGNDGGGN